MTTPNPNAEDPPIGEAPGVAMLPNGTIATEIRASGFWRTAAQPRVQTALATVANAVLAVLAFAGTVDIAVIGVANTVMAAFAAVLAAWYPSRSGYAGYGFDDSGVAGYGYGGRG